jgi:hypothetical protein
MVQKFIIALLSSTSMRNVSPATSTTVVWLHQAAEFKEWQNEQLKRFDFCTQQILNYSSRQKEIH